MLVPVLISLSALQLTTASDYSSYQWQPIYQKPQGQLFQPQLDYNSVNNRNSVSMRQSYQDLVTNRNGNYGPYRSPTHGPEVLEEFQSPGFQDRDYRPPLVSGQRYTPLTGQVFEERNYHIPPPHAPYHNHFPNHHGPPPHHDFPHHNQHDKNGYQRPQNHYPSYNDFQEPPNRGSDGFIGPQTNRKPVAPGGSRPTNPLEVIFSWKQVDFEFPNSNMREEMIRNQQFIPRNNLILDVDVYGTLHL